ncbi:MAG TPA: hypothetical protein PK771_15880 [Spirochaetota bacterium]|nr:hypothetical protein [Spirochaetota bacterium]
MLPKKINGINHDWGDIVVINTVTGLEITCTGIDYTQKQDKSHKYGLGNEPIATGHGNKSYEGKIKMYKSGAHRLLLAAKTMGCKGIVDIPETAMNINVTYMNGYDLINDTLIGVSFTEEPNSVSQGDDEAIVELSFIYFNINQI